MFLELRASWATYALIQVLFPIVNGSGNLVCTFRYSLVVFPVYVLLARWTEQRWRAVSLAAALAVLAGLLMISYASGYRLTI
jgi:hypothetical protein